MFLYFIKDKDRESYNSFLQSCSDIHVQQGLEWMDFQNELNSRVDSKVVAVLQQQEAVSSIVLSCAYVIIKTVLNKNYLLVNKGPVCQKELFDKKEFKKKFQFLNKELIKIAKKNNCIFIRYDFPFSNSLNEVENLPNKQFKVAHASFNPKRTLILDLKKTEEDLLKDMKSKGRYNIKLATRKGVKIRVSTDISDIEKFYEISKTTASRDGFAIQSLDFYKTMVSKLMPKGLCKIYFAQVEDEVIAANIITCFSNTVTYYYGASSNKFRNLMAPYLLQWKAILDAKEAGFLYYDFLGIAENDNSKHSWAGITSFKRKFGGEDLDYWKSKELVLNPLFYYLMIFVKKLKQYFK